MIAPCPRQVTADIAAAYDARAAECVDLLGSVEQSESSRRCPCPGVSVRQDMDEVQARHVGKSKNHPQPDPISNDQARRRAILRPWRAEEGKPAVLRHECV